jgi:hypothetical protein
MKEPKYLDRSEARTCPFCGSRPTIEHYHGGGLQKRMISCSDDYCHAGPNVCGPTKKKALQYWNARSKC